MPTNLTMLLGCSPRCYPLNITQKITTTNLVFISQQRSLNFSFLSKASSSPKVIDDRDCLPNPTRPWLKLCPEKDTNTGVVMDSFYNLVDNQVVRLNRRNCLGVPETAICFASSGEWLGFIDPHDDSPIYLTNPYFSDNDLSSIRLPSLATLLSVFSVERDPETGLVTEYNVLDYDGQRDEVDEWNLDPTRSCKADSLWPMIQQFSLSHFDARDPDCVVTAVCNNDVVYSRIWGEPKNDFEWTKDGLTETSRYCKQVVFSNTTKLFYIFDDLDVQALDLLRDRKQQSKLVYEFNNIYKADRYIERQLMDEFKEEKNKELRILRSTCTATTGYLASLDDTSESSDIVLIIRHIRRTAKRPSYNTKHLDVYKVDFCERKLLHLTTLEDSCVFVGRNSQCFSACASKYPGLQLNAIYFTDSFYCKCTGSKIWHNDHGIFNLENNSIKPITCIYTPEHPLPQNVSDNNSSSRWKQNEKLFWVSPSNTVNR